MLANLFFRCFILGCMFDSAMSKNPECSEPADPGTGEKQELRFFFKSDKNSCYPFFYKGEGGNLNNFDSDRSCVTACLPDHAQKLYPESSEVCSLPADHGMCQALHLKYFFDPEIKACRLFHYGGCQGNGNRFDSKENCIAMCQAKSGRSLGSDINPDESSVNAGLIVGIVGGVVFAVAVIATIAMAVVRRNDRKRVPTKEVEMDNMS